MKVRAIGAAQTWSEPFYYTFAILPPWYLTWWAYVLYLLVGVLSLTGLYLYQRRRWQLQTNLRIEQEKAQRLQELDSFKSRFYTNITHEFRTPLTVIKGMAGQINNNQRIKSLILRNTGRLLHLVNQLLDLTKLESKNLPVNWVQGDVVPYLQYLTESCHSLAVNKNLNLAFFTKEDRLVMDFDEKKLQHIFINVLSNAIKFTPEYGSVKVIVAKVLDAGGELLELRIQDTGKGIPQSELPYIFDRFYQIDDSSTRRDEGSGIGLALVKELVDLLGGHIKVESETGKGSTFLIYLPVHKNATEKATRGLWCYTPIISSDNDLDRVSHLPVDDEDEKPLILVIEDNSDVTEYIISCLIPEFKVKTARNGKDGIEKALLNVPDVILSDIMMPEMDGFEVCRKLKADRRCSHIPIILLTAKATQEDKVRGLSCGADAYLTKPFDREELLVRLSNLAVQGRHLQKRLVNPSDITEQPHALEEQEAGFLEEVNRIIESNLDNDLFDTNHLCRAMAMSRTQLYRKLKALTGQPTASYVRSVRLDKAKNLLETTDLPIGEIAFQVGFKDFSHFSRSFSREFGEKPSETRN